MVSAKITLLAVLSSVAATYSTSSNGHGTQIHPDCDYKYCLAYKEVS